MLSSSGHMPQAELLSFMQPAAFCMVVSQVQVQFPDDWRVSTEEAEHIKGLLDNIASEKKAAAEKGSPGKWYLKLSNEQVAECKKDPQLFVVRRPNPVCSCCTLAVKRALINAQPCQAADSQNFHLVSWSACSIGHRGVKCSRCAQELSKLHSFEEQFEAASKAQASKYGMPPITLDELPPTMDPIGEYAISQKEVKWIVQKAKESAAQIKKTDPRFVDPYSTEEFRQEQKRVAEKLGIGAEKLAELQKQATPEKWKQMEA
jgi:hypothetical protein